MARDDYAKRPQDPLVEQLRPDPSQPPERSVTLAGFLGDSDREGYRRLYFTRELEYYAEFRAEDILRAAPIAAGSPPFVGEDATRVTLRRTATVEYTRASAAHHPDEFDIQLRLGSLAPTDDPIFLTGPGDTFCDGCPVTPGTCMGTCETCPTNCGTCATCASATCDPTCTEPRCAVP
jgi:hypothetical protein